jgi:hypothetical protein
MTKRDRRDGDRRPAERRDVQPDGEQQRRPSEADMQEGDSLTALKAILAKVAALLSPLKLTQDESISLVEQLYGGVLEMDLKLAGETDDKRKSSVLAHIQNTKISRNAGKIVIDYPTGDGSPEPKPDVAPETAAEPQQHSAPAAAIEPAAEENTGTDES